MLHETMSYNERHLPHWQPEGSALFVTWRLHDSMPRNCDAPRNPKLTAGQQFVLDDREWHTTATGPKWLSDPRVAKIVADALGYGEDKLNHLYKLIAWVIMPNHVHILIDPSAPLARINKSIKNFTARQANQILGLTGPFWQQEGYDHWLRTEDEFEKTIRYIEANPVAANLCTKPENYHWSSAWTGREAYPTKL